MASAPVVVSPLIKFARYSALLIGISYGARHTKTLQKREDRIMTLKAKRKEEEVKKVEEQAKAASGEGSIFD